MAPQHPAWLKTGRILALALASCVQLAGCKSESVGEDAWSFEMKPPVKHDAGTPDDSRTTTDKLPLETSGRTFLSRRGAHSYVLFPVDSAQGPGLYWRQYSDIISYLGVYSPLLDPLFTFWSESECTPGTHKWAATHVMRTYSCGPLDVIETTAYARPDAVAVRFRLNSPEGPANVAIMGQATTLAASTSMSQDDALPGIRLTVASQFVTPKGEEFPVSFSVAVAGSPAPTSSSVDQGAGTWSLNYALEGGKTEDIVLTFALAEGGPPEGLVLDSEGLYEVVGKLLLDLGAWFDGTPSPDRLEQEAYATAWYLFWENTASPAGSWDHEAVTPSKRHYFRGVRQWDSAFHALVLAQGHDDAVQLGRSQIELFTGHALSDDRFPREIWVTGPSEDAHPPGLLSWASLAVAEALGQAAPEGDDAGSDSAAADFIADVYPKLKANHGWFFSTRDSDQDGLCEWSGADSGWDTSPRWDGGPVEAVDLACWLYLDAFLLGRMAKDLAMAADVQRYDQEMIKLRQAIQMQFWDESDKLFYDLDIATGAPVKVPTPAAFLPLFVGAATQIQAESVAAHMSEAEVFGTPYLLPTVSPASDAYQSDNYWRGPVWVVLNALAVWGLERYGLTQAATQLREQTLSLIEGQGFPREYYDSQTGAGLGAPNFMGTAAFYMLLHGENPTVW